MNNKYICVDGYFINKEKVSGFYMGKDVLYIYLPGKVIQIDGRTIYDETKERLAKSFGLPFWNCDICDKIEGE